MNICLFTCCRIDKNTMLFSRRYSSSQVSMQWSHFLNLSYTVWYSGSGGRIATLCYIHSKQPDATRHANFSPFRSRNLAQKNPVMAVTHITTLQHQLYMYFIHCKSSGVVAVKNNAFLNIHLYSFFIITLYSLLGRLQIVPYLWSMASSSLVILF